MVNVAARVGGLVGAAAAFVVAVARGGPPVWTIAGLTASALVLVAVVLFVPSETPSRRLAQLIRAWRNSGGPDPERSATTSPSPSRDGG
ncbi:hypothetical protein ACYF6T_11655 [Streptomyces sp. 7R007]